MTDRDLAIEGSPIEAGRGPTVRPRSSRRMSPRADAGPSARGAQRPGKPPSCHLIDDVGQLGALPLLKDAVHFDDAPDALLERDARLEIQQAPRLVTGTVAAVDLAALLTIRTPKVAGGPTLHRRVATGLDDEIGQFLE